MAAGVDVLHDCRKKAARLLHEHCIIAVWSIPVFQVRPTAFPAADISTTSPAPIEAVAASDLAPLSAVSGLSSWVSEDVSVSERPELGSAKVLTTLSHQGTQRAAALQGCAIKAVTRCVLFMLCRPSQQCHAVCSPCWGGARAAATCVKGVFLHGL